MRFVEHEKLNTCVHCGLCLAACPTYLELGTDDRIYVRFFVKEPEVWTENRRLQREQRREVREPLISIFRRPLLGNTLTASW